MERDQLKAEILRQGRNFNSHAHVERDAFDIETSSFYDDFNSHAHVERDKYLFTHVNDIFISTHTLTWSVTKYNKNCIDEINNFNSHAHVERDTFQLM